VEFLDPHVAFFTFAENYAKPDCGLPVSGRFAFKPTRQPVVRSFWEGHGASPLRAFTTIGNWRQSWRSVLFEGEAYKWTKDVEFEKVLDLPGRTDAAFELALSSIEDADRARLTASGWSVRDGLSVSLDVDV